MTARLIACANHTWRALALFAFVVAVLGAVVSGIEGWPIGDGIWWAFTTATTTGYGDLAPASVLGRALGVLTMFIGIIGIGVIVGRIASSVIETRDAWKHEEQEQVKGDVADTRHDLLVMREELRLLRVALTPATPVPPPPTVPTQTFPLPDGYSTANGHD